MTNDKTVTISRELAQELLSYMRASDSPQLKIWANLLGASLAAPVVESQPDAELLVEFFEHGPMATIDWFTPSSFEHGATKVYAATPELAELQAPTNGALIKDLTEVITQQSAEIERLKGGQGGPVTLPERSFVGDIRNPYRYTVLHDGYISGWNAYQDAMVKLGPLYTSPPAPVSLKDHEFRELANRLRDTAIQYRDADQLRERISGELRACLDKVKQ